MHVLDDVQLVVLRERGEVHGVPQARRLVRRVRGEVGRVRLRAAEGREVVALAAGDLRVEQADERREQALAGADVEHDLVVVLHPVQVAPDLAAEHALRALVLRQQADGLQHRDHHADVRVVLVGGVVGVDDLGLDDLQQRGELIAQRRVGRVLDHLAGVAELQHRLVVARVRGLVLLVDAHRRHLLVGVVGVRADAGAAAAVGAGDAAEALVLLQVALGDAVVGHDLEVVLVGADAEVGDVREDRLHRLAAGDEDLGVRVAQFHVRSFFCIHRGGAENAEKISVVRMSSLRPLRLCGASSYFLGKLAAATAWPTRRLFSSGTNRLIFTSGNSRARISFARASTMSPPSPVVTRPRISTLS